MCGTGVSGDSSRLHSQVYHIWYTHNHNIHLTRWALIVVMSVVMSVEVWAIYGATESVVNPLQSSLLIEFAMLGAEPL